MRKTVIVLKGYPRLSETFIAQEILGLERAGFDLHLVALRHPTDSKRHPVNDEISAPVSYLPEYLHEESARVLKAMLAQLHKAGFWRAFASLLGDLGRDFTRNRVRRFGQAAVLSAEWPEDAAWIHSHFIHTPASVAAYASQMLELGWSCSAHAKDIWTSADWDLRDKLGSMAWAVTCTKSGYVHLKALAGARGNVHLSYHGLDLDRFSSFEAERPGRDGTDPADPVRIVSVGRAVEKKGYDILLHALSRLPQALNWRFIHIGGGEKLTELKALADNLGISDRIEWRGALDQTEVLAEYRRSDLFALACRITADGDRDGLPNVIVEASSQRLPTVSTDISGIPELITHRETGLLGPPDNPDAFCALLEEAIADPELRHRLGNAVEAKVRAEFDHHASIMQLKQLFADAWTKAI